MHVCMYLFTYAVTYLLMKLMYSYMCLFVHARRRERMRVHKVT
jgi:hypothetical protein